MIRLTNATCTEALIGALEEVEGAKNVLIMLESESGYTMVANCGPDSIKNLAAEAIVICNLKFQKDKEN